MDTKIKRHSRDTDAPCEIFWSAAEIAKRWGCSRSTVVRNLSAAGVSGYFFNAKPRSLRRYRRGDVVAFEERCQSVAQI